MECCFRLNVEAGFGGWFWRRDAEIALLKSVDVRLPRGPAAKEIHEASAFGG